MDQRQYNLWMQEWQQELHAQQLLNPTEQFQNNQAVGEYQQENDIQQLIKQFTHVDEAIIYSTYFEQTNLNFKASQELLKLQFPKDPAFQSITQESQALKKVLIKNDCQLEERKDVEEEKKIEEKEKNQKQENDENIQNEQKMEIQEPPFQKFLIDDNLPSDQNEVSKNKLSYLEKKDLHEPDLVASDDEKMHDQNENIERFERVSVLQKDEQITVDLSIDIIKEILIHLQIRLAKKNQNQFFFQILQVLHQLLSNIVNDPVNEKFHRIKLQNKKINETITRNIECINLLEILNFQSKQNMVSEAGGLEAMLVLESSDALDLYQKFKNVCELLNELLSTHSTSQLTKHFDQQNEKQMKNQNQYMSKTQKQNTINKIANHDQNMKSKLLEAQFNRQDRKVNDPALVNQQRAIAYQNNQLDTYIGQLSHYRKMQQKKFQRPTGPPRIITVSDIQNKIDQETMMKNNAYSANTDSEKWGIRALDLTNQFRKSTNEGHEGNKHSLRWSKQLHDIALQHSKNMANGVVPFGHDGFNQRMRQVPFFVRSFSENVAYNSGCSDPIETAVRGWINSPGHRKNMLANNDLCAIAVHLQGGTYWFTQLFALT